MTIKIHWFLNNVVYALYGVMGFAYLNRIGLSEAAISFSLYYKTLLHSSPSLSRYLFGNAAYSWIK